MKKIIPTLLILTALFGLCSCDEKKVKSYNYLEDDDFKGKSVVISQDYYYTNYSKKYDSRATFSVYDDNNNLVLRKTTYGSIDDNIDMKYEYKYDSENRVILEKTATFWSPDDIIVTEESHEYDSHGNEVKYKYNSDYGDSSENKSSSISFTYDDKDNLTNVRGTGTTEFGFLEDCLINYEYNEDNEVVSRTVIARNNDYTDNNFTYVYDEAGRIVKKEYHHIAPSIDTTTKYNSAMPEDAYYDEYGEYYSYDSFGNLVSYQKVDFTDKDNKKIISEVIKAYDENNNIVLNYESSYSVNQKSTYTYDEHNNCISYAIFHDLQPTERVVYEYDSNNRLIKEIMYSYRGTTYYREYEYVNVPA